MIILFDVSSIKLSTPPVPRLRPSCNSPKESDIIIELLLHPHRPLIINLVLWINATIEILQPPRKPRIKIRLPLSLIRRILARNVTILSADGRYDFIDSNPVCVEEQHDLVIRINKCLECVVWEEHPPSVL
jgi:hypothetical protein